MTDPAPSERVPVLVSAVGAMPPAVAQDELRDFTVRLWPELEGSKYLPMFGNAAIDTRHLIRPLEWYLEGWSMPERFEVACSAVVEMAVAASQRALAAAGLRPTDVDALVFVSTTAVRAPLVDVDLAVQVGLRADVHRTSLFGMASLGGAAGLGLAADLVRAGYDNVLVVASEANSLMFVPGPMTPEIVVSMALFSDGAAAAVVQAPSTNGLRLVARHSTLVPSSVDVMGFTATPTGLRWHLAPTVPEVVAAHLPGSVTAALEHRGWTIDDLRHLLLHPGSSKLLDGAAAALGLAPDRLDPSRAVLRAHGNVSSATILLILEAFLASSPGPGRGLVCGMGPGFAFENLLVEVGAP